LLQVDHEGALVARHGFTSADAREDFVGEPDCGGGGGDEGADVGEVDCHGYLLEVAGFAAVIWAGEDEGAGTGGRLGLVVNVGGTGGRCGVRGLAARTADEVAVVGNKGGNCELL
jgi:hypothetical protein